MCLYLKHYKNALQAKLHANKPTVQLDKDFESCAYAQGKLMEQAYSTVMPNPQIELEE